MSYLTTIGWLHKTFTTRQRTAELLRPELEEHVITTHDYELATRFLPGPSMDWHLVYGIGTSAVMYGYGSFLARPRWNTWRLRLGSVAAFLVGSTYGTFRHFMLHYKFANSLENPQGFISALNHIDERLGGGGRVGFAFTEMLVKKSDVVSDDRTGHAQDVGILPGEGWVEEQRNINGVSRVSEDPVQFRTRWDEIRATNLRTIGQSSWDIIRQRHERNRLPDSTTLNKDRFSVTEADERAAAQARFDALLDAERRHGI